MDEGNGPLVVNVHPHGSVYEAAHQAGDGVTQEQSVSVEKTDALNILGLLQDLVEEDYTKKRLEAVKRDVSKIIQDGYGGVLKRVLREG
jgi:uncharacterized membrane-anchored protein YjiN (DUF445 family)